MSLTIGDFLTRIKRPISLNAETDYKLVTIKMHHKGVILRGLKKGYDIKSKMFQVKEGDFILSGIDARNGAFGIVPKELDNAIVTNDFWYFELNKEIIDIHFFLELTSTDWFDNICRLGSDGTTQRIRLQKDKFFNQNIFLPPITEQKKFINKFIKIKAVNYDLETEIENQQDILTKLKQSILQEAIEGKLTAKWREENQNIEPSSILLKKIKVEKAQLIKEKKIKKSKSLANINENEMTFNLPNSWEWCRLGDSIYLANNLDIQKKLSPNEIVNYVDIDAVNNNTFKIDNIKTKPVKELSTRARRILKKDFIIYSTVRPYLNNMTIISEEKENFIGSTGFIVFKPIININKYLFYYLLSPFINSYYLNLLSGFNSPSITNEDFYNTPFPLPPIEEQQEILNKIEKLFNICDKIEEQINSSKKNTQTLMQSVLKEAFEN